MKKQSFGIILAAVLGAGSLFSAVIPGTDALFTTALPGTGAVTVQAEASNSFGGSGSEEDDSYQDFAASEFSLSWTRRIFSQMKKNPSFWISWKPSPGNTIWKWQLPQ